MKVSDIMQTAVKTVTSDTPISEVIVSLADVQVSALPVVDTRGRAVGVVSSTDLITAQSRVRTAQERRLQLEQTQVRDLMTPKPFTIESTVDVQEAARHMLYGEVRRLLVEESGVLVGVISQTDIVHAVATGTISLRRGIPLTVFKLGWSLPRACRIRRSRVK
jgi:predicted transcriptional regulator